MGEADRNSAIERAMHHRVTRRGFMHGSLLAATSAWLAACTGTSGGSAAPAGTAIPSFAVPADLEKELFIYNWGDYIAKSNTDLFKSAFGLNKLTYDVFDSNEVMLAKLQAGGVGQYDLGAPTAEYIPGMVEEGFLEKLDLSRIPNQKYINAKFKGLWWDPTDEYQLPKDWGTTGITLRRNFVEEEVKTWKQFFEVAPKYSGRIVVVDSMGDVFTAPLKALGYSLNSVDPKELNAARELLLGLAPHVGFLDSNTYEVPIRDEEAVLGLTWTGGVVELRDVPETADVEYIVPDDGTLYWMDTWVIFKDAPHPNASHAFLNFIHDPQIQATETVANRYATPNDEAKKLVPQEILDDPAVFVPDSVFPRLEGAEDTSGDPLRNEIWEEFRSKIGQS